MPSMIFNAIDRSDAVAIRRAVENGADPNEELDEPPFWRPLQAAIEQGEHGATSAAVRDMVKALLAGGADVNAWDREHNLTPLLKAVYFEPSVVEILLAAGADPNVHSEEGVTPLKWAVNDVRNPSLVASMLASGATTTMDKIGGFCGCNALQLAVGNLDIVIVRLLLEAGANPWVKDVDQRIAIRHLPAPTDENRADWDAVRELVQKRAETAPRV